VGVRSVLVATTLACVSLLPAAARAYCRTTTQPGSVDPSISGQCWTTGKPIAWPGGQVPYGISSAGSMYVSAADAQKVADVAFSQWNDAACIGGSPGVQAYDVGLLDFDPDGGTCRISNQCEPATQDVIYFRDTGWEHGNDNITIALTTVSYGTQDGTIFEAYTEVNSQNFQLIVQEPPPPNLAANVIDLQSVLTHEAGHFLGLAHSPDTSAVMYYEYHPGSVTLTADDLSGICAMYPQKPASSCGVAPPRSSALGIAAGMGLLAIVGLRRRRRASLSPR
jgi:hypothetical protein